MAHSVEERKKIKQSPGRNEEEGEERRGEFADYSWGMKNTIDVNPLRQQEKFWQQSPLEHAQTAEGKKMLMCQK